MMLNSYTTQETAAPTQGLTPNLEFPLDRLPRTASEDFFINTYQSNTSKLNLKDQTAQGQALRCINNGATTVSVKFDLALTDEVSFQPHTSDLTLELGSINDQGVYTPTQAYTGNKLESASFDPCFGRPFVFKDLEIKDAKATQNLVIRLTDIREYLNPSEITNPFSIISLTNFNATFPKPLQS